MQTLKGHSNVGSWKDGHCSEHDGHCYLHYISVVFFGDANLLFWKCFLLGKSTAVFWDYADGNLPDLQCCARTSAVGSVYVKELARIIGDRFVLYSIRVQWRYEGWFTPTPCTEFADCTAFRFLAFEQLQFHGLSHIWHCYWSTIGKSVACQPWHHIIHLKRSFTWACRKTSGTSNALFEWSDSPALRGKPLACVICWSVIWM